MRTVAECKALDMPSLRLEIDERLVILEKNEQVSPQMFNDVCVLVDMYSGLILDQLQRICNKIIKP